jgi:uncharacterized protein YkwD
VGIVSQPSRTHVTRTRDGTWRRAADAIREVKRVPAVLAVLLALAAGLAGQAAAADTAPAAIERAQALDQAILLQLNATRATHGLRPLVLSPALASAAASHSRSMLQGGFFAHESQDGSSFALRLKRFYRPAGYASWSAGENLLYDSGALDAPTAIQAWLASPEHRRNMLDPTWREVGVAAMHSASAGGTFGGDATWVVTMDFGVRTGGRKAVGKPKPKPTRTLATRATPSR